MTQDPFQSLISKTQDFLAELSQNNTRDWFHAQKSRYDSALKAPAMALLDVLSADLERSTGAPVTPKLFRPQRDIRFSKDKTPYHLHLHMLWGVAGSAGTGFFFGIEPDHVVLGAGCMGMQGAALTRFRERVDSEDGAALALVLDTLRAQGFRQSDPELKRVPSAYGKDHPRGDLLRHKSLTCWQDITMPPADLRTALSDGFAPLEPLIRWLQG